jgi:hypothetical protein
MRVPPSRGIIAWLNTGGEVMQGEGAEITEQEACHLQPRGPGWSARSMRPSDARPHHQCISGVEVAPWRLALVMVRQYIEGLTDPPMTRRPATVANARPMGVGYTVHLTETCDADQPVFITQVGTPPATTQDSVIGPAIQQDVADRDLLPGPHVLDSGDVDADFLVTV